MERDNRSVQDDLNCFGANLGRPKWEAKLLYEQQDAPVKERTEVVGLVELIAGEG
jgi:hypothetical protein